MNKTTQNRPALGKGLASLLSTTAQHNTAPTVNPNDVVSEAPVKPKPLNPVAQGQGAEADATPNKDRHPGISMCLLDDIVPNAFQPRRSFDDASIDELAQSIRENGLIQPLVVRKAQKGYQLIAGERRLRAAKIAGLKQIPIVIRRTTDKEALELAIIENVQREDLNCIDTALAYQQLAAEFDMTQEQVAQRVGKDRASVANALRLLKLPQKIQNWLKQETLTFGHGKALSGIEDPNLLENFASQAVDSAWSVRELERQIQLQKDNRAGLSNSAGEKIDVTPLELRFKSLGNELSKKYSTKVAVRGNEKKGKIVVEYFSREDLDRILDQLMTAK